MKKTLKIRQLKKRRVQQAYVFWLRGKDMDRDGRKRKEMDREKRRVKR